MNHDGHPSRMVLLVQLILIGVCACAALALPAFSKGLTASAQTLPIAHTAPAASHSLGLLGFGAKQKKHQVLLNWTTANEVQIVGFNLWRRTGNQPVQQLNAKLIPALSLGTLTGNSYSARDKKVTPGKVYFYRLEVMTSDGYSAFTEEVRVKVK